MKESEIHAIIGPISVVLLDGSTLLKEVFCTRTIGNFEGWRVRQTALMLSTVYDDEAVTSVLGASIPEIVVKWLIDNDAIYRLSTMGSGVNVG